MRNRDPSFNRPGGNGKSQGPEPGRLAHLLLLLYPPSFRKEYGDEWLESAARYLRENKKEWKPFPALRGMVGLLVDTLSSITRIWFDRTSSCRPSSYGKARNLDTIIQDIRFGLRTLRKRPLFTLIAVGTLGLGIGGTTAIFSVVNGVLLRPHPYEEPGELVSVWQTYPEWRDEPMLAEMWNWGYLAYPGYQRWRDGQTHFQEVAIHNST
jgi:hypothetical protein